MNIKWRFELDEDGDLIDNLSKLNYLPDDEWEDKKKFIDIINTLHQENQSVFKSINSKIRFYETIIEKSDDDYIVHSLAAQILTELKELQCIHKKRVWDCKYFTMDEYSTECCKPSRTHSRIMNVHCLEDKCEEMEYEE